VSQKIINNRKTKITKKIINKNIYKLKITESKNKKNKIIKITRKENCFIHLYFQENKDNNKKRTNQSH